MGEGEVKRAGEHETKAIHLILDLVRDPTRYSTHILGKLSSAALSYGNAQNLHL